MLYRLEIENFASIRDRQALDLRVGGNVQVEDDRFAEVFPGANVFVPKVVAIYGANASGKTNLLLALKYVIEMAAHAALEPRMKILPFNSHETMSMPTRIAIEFGGLMDPSRPERRDYGFYRYELCVQTLHGAGAPAIQAESLRRRPLGQGKWQRVFERNAQSEVKGSDVFELKGFGHLVKTLRPDSTVIASFAFFNHPAAKFFAEAAQEAIIQLTVLSSSDEFLVHKILAANPEALAKLNHQLARIDLGLEGLRYDQTSDGPQPLFKHFGLQSEMHWTLESHGTRSWIRLFPLIDTALQRGTLCAIDELDSSIHSLLLSEIIRWFLDCKNTNPRNSQLWFTSHSATLLEDLKKEEVVLCEKDRQGKTSVYSLMDVKARRDDNLYRKYLGGAYGGVPLLG